MRIYTHSARSDQSVHVMILEHVRETRVELDVSSPNPEQRGQNDKKKLFSYQRTLLLPVLLFER